MRLATDWGVVGISADKITGGLRGNTRKKKRVKKIKVIGGTKTGTPLMYK